MTQTTPGAPAAEQAGDALVTGTGRVCTLTGTRVTTSVVPAQPGCR